MRVKAKGLLLIVSLGLACGLAAVAAQAGTEGREAVGLEAMAEPVQYWGSTYCERLHWACVYKELRDEVGEGNCRRYRRICGGFSRYCERLRRACIFKEERDEVGLGNCRRYREQCGEDDD